ncbi:MAG: hypothetical protein QOG34_1797 [Frankiaceae bacterium]|jgi:hypothetical protein|nr:hypothetical protein [Frankiaceae bacterium]
MVDPDVVNVEQRLHDLLTDDHLAVRVPAGAVEAIHSGVRRRRRARFAGTAGLAFVAVAATALTGTALLHRGARLAPGQVTSETPGVWVPGSLTALPRTMAAPAAIAASGGLVWVAGPATDTPGTDVLARVDAASRQVTSMSTGVASDVAATPLRLWVALRPGATDTQCALQLRETTRGQIVSTFPLPCDASGDVGPNVTANGSHAWVAVDDGSATRLRLYTAGSSAPPVERVLPGRLAGPHLLAIGGTSVYVVTRDDAAGTVLHQLSADRLRPLATISVPGARLMAYGNDQLYVADASSVGAYPADLGGRRGFVSGYVRSLTTGAGVVWSDPAGTSFEGFDPHTGKVAGITKVPVVPGGLLRADGAVLWAVASYRGFGVGLQSAEPAS